MRSFILPVVIAGSLLAPAAFAATTTDGMVKSIDQKAGVLTLDNGMVYKLPPGFKDAAVKPGARVAVTWDMKGIEHAAQAVTILK
jgi:hypothetical protein